MKQNDMKSFRAWEHGFILVGLTKLVAGHIDTQEHQQIQKNEITSKWIFSV